MKTTNPAPNHYSIVIEWDDDEKSFVGRVPALRGLLAYGATREETAAELESMIQDALAVMEESIG